MIVRRSKSVPLAYGGSITATAHRGEDFAGAHSAILATIEVSNTTFMAHITAQGARALAAELLECAAAIDQSDSIEAVAA